MSKFPQLKAQSSLPQRATTKAYLCFSLTCSRMKRWSRSHFSRAGLVVIDGFQARAMRLITSWSSLILSSSAGSITLTLRSVYYGDEREHGHARPMGPKKKRGDHWRR